MQSTRLTWQYRCRTEKPCEGQGPTNSYRNIVYEKNDASCTNLEPRAFKTPIIEEFITDTYKSRHENSRYLGANTIVDDLEDSFLVARLIIHEGMHRFRILET